MIDAVIAARWPFAFTIMFHYLFPVLTMGLGVMIAVLKTLASSAARSRCSSTRSRSWAGF